eukprot:CAMPEP_0172788416 /NCGR_PEP_ID=MMETSP1074-20121228/206944_1 /TAXON_ID=2916 /ORGANISM="Ceratium fusus, Strain PA161109" /LENGTH=118 /DNA_ID=CAMNT_0013625441 /DNA_START=682 /DNA_END=1038 /DNA_ORIENTATION=+
MTRDDNRADAHLGFFAHSDPLQDHLRAANPEAPHSGFGPHNSSITKRQKVKLANLRAAIDRNTTPNLGAQKPVVQRQEVLEGASSADIQKYINKPPPDIHATPHAMSALCIPANQEPL